LLSERGIPYQYREYTQDPLDEAEIREVLSLLGVAPAEVLRKRDKAYKALGLTGAESAAVLIGHMATHPTLLERPIGVLGDRAVVGRPPENLLSLVNAS
jgi:arsenate reductase